MRPAAQHATAPVLVVGASGFIGRQIVFALARKGCALAVHGRHLALLQQLFPGARHHVRGPASWRPVLEGIDAVVMAAGIMGESASGSYAQIHDRAALPSSRSFLVGGKPLAAVDPLDVDVRDVDAVGQVYTIEELAQRRALAGLRNLVDQRALGSQQMLAVLGAGHAPVVEIIRIESGRKGKVADGLADRVLVADDLVRKRVAHAKAGHVRNPFRLGRTACSLTGQRPALPLERWAELEMPAKNVSCLFL
jgi:uncharacterized protein YbjT (DUF2867 family)